MYKRKYFFDFYCFFIKDSSTSGKQLDIKRVIFDSEHSIISHYQCQLEKFLLVKYHHRIAKGTENIL